MQALIFESLEYFRDLELFMLSFLSMYNFSKGNLLACPWILETWNCSIPTTQTTYFKMLLQTTQATFSKPLLEISQTTPSTLSKPPQPQALFPNFYKSPQQLQPHSTNHPNNLNHFCKPSHICFPKAPHLLTLFKNSNQVKSGFTNN